MTSNCAAVMIMGVLATVLGLSAANPALAKNQETGPYIGLDTGVSFGGTRKLDVATTPTPTPAGITIRDKLGYSGGVFAGYDFGNIRAEAEVNQSRTTLSSVSATVPLVKGGGSAPAAGNFAYASGTTRMRNFMVSAVFDAVRNEGVEIYAGAGVGYSSVRMANYTVSGQADFLSKAANGASWQVLAGLRYALNDRLAAGVRYRYLQARSIKMYDNAAPSRLVSGSIGAQYLSATLEFRM